MSLIQNSLNKLNESFKQVYDREVPLKNYVNDSLLSYKATKDEYIRKSFLSALNEFKQNISSLNACNEKAEIESLINNIEDNNLKDIKKILSKINILTQEIKESVKTHEISFEAKNLPDTIKNEVKADITEMEACFNHNLYRSAVILCGRILETVLHRKYYDTVGTDLLEKSPGIGLGKIIAKLIEKEVDLDPGLTQQIHLINQVRIFTVHKKQKTFYPSKAQTHAMILYTMDVIEKLF